MLVSRFVLAAVTAGWQDDVEPTALFTAAEPMLWRPARSGLPRAWRADWVEALLMAGLMKVLGAVIVKGVVAVIGRAHV